MEIAGVLLQHQLRHAVEGDRLIGGDRDHGAAGRVVGGVAEQVRNARDQGVIEIDLIHAGLEACHRVVAEMSIEHEGVAGRGSCQDGVSGARRNDGSRF